MGQDSDDDVFGSMRWERVKKEGKTDGFSKFRSLHFTLPKNNVIASHDVLDNTENAVTAHCHLFPCGMNGPAKPITPDCEVTITEYSNFLLIT